MQLIVASDNFRNWRLLQISCGSVCDGMRLLRVAQGVGGDLSACIVSVIRRRCGEMMKGEEWV